MSTRGLYTFTDDEKHPEKGHHVYVHHDNYPDGEHGGLAKIEAALLYTLPRFEADEFAAGFVAATKRSGSDYPREICGGDVRLIRSGTPSEVMPLGVEYRYEVYARAGRLFVRIFDLFTLLFEGTVRQARRWADERAKKEECAPLPY